MASPRLPISAVALDLDGTMLDTATDIAAAVDATLAQLGHPAQGVEAVRGMIGRGVVQLLRSALIRSSGAEPPEELIARGREIFYSEYRESLSRSTRFYPGAREGIVALRSAGFPLACVTNKPARFTEPLLEAVGIRDSFALVISGDTLPSRKPDPGQLLHAAQVLGLPPALLLLVGDSVHDLQAARAAGCPVYCVGYGYCDDPAGLLAGADAGLDSLTDILPRVARVNPPADLRGSPVPGEIPARFPQ
jgi:phosphoglycolate phosphatase